MLDIYPARELPMEGITSEWLLSKVTLEHKIVSSKEDLIKNIKASKSPINVMIGAGDIGELVNKVKNELNLEN